ncbi:aldehyde dehydrogenase family protein, partial [Burkholderia cenocepacia]|nr:aldehyde dehydrogenase family protein [Burkholderia cenocepacia]
RGSARRIFVPQGAFGDRFLARFADVTSKITADVFDADPQPFMGAVISARAAAKLVDAQSRLVEQGAKPIIAMTQRDPRLGFVNAA